ncbi:MAG: uracil-DNA glycosylase family protein [Bryobacterales bacterium]|nr:uracil-DNA glycosylase family protein [Bryobacterales bacterium]
MTQLMQEIDAEFRSASGISERRYYKIYYSHIHPFPLLVLGQNPGGETDGTDLSASETFYENWEHDYLCFRNNPRYALARPMCALLAAVLQTSAVNVLRQVPATNVIFRRSRNTESLNLSPAKAAEESAPALRRILEAVNPRVVVLIANTAYKLFKEVHCEPPSIREDSKPRVFTPNGRANACIFLSAQARVIGLNRTVPLFMVGHPSKYAGRSEWPQVVEALSQGLKRCGVSPIEDAALVSVKPIESYGTHV